MLRGLFRRLTASTPSVLGATEPAPRRDADACGWRPTADQRARLRRLGDWAPAALPAIFCAGQHTNGGTRQYEPYPWRTSFGEAPLDAYYREAIDRLGRELGSDAIGLVLPESIVFPCHWKTLDGSGYDSLSDLLMQTVAERWLLDHPDEYGVGLLAGRIRYILAHPLTETEIAPDKVSFGSAPIENLYAWPRLGECISLLEHVREAPAALRHVRSLVLGEWDTPLPPCPPNISISTTACGYPVDTSYRSYGPAMARSFPPFWEVVARAGGFGYEEYVASVTHFPPAVFTYIGPTAAMCDADRIWQGYSRRLAWACAQDPTDIRLVLLGVFSSYSGARFLLKGCELIETHQITSLPRYPPDAIPRVAQHMVALEGFDEEDRPDDVVAALAAFSSATLWLILPHAGVAEPLVLRALGAERAEPLRALIHVLADARYGDNFGSTDHPNCPDPRSGVIDPGEVREAVRAAGERLAKQVIKAFRAPKGDVQRTLTLIQAVMGWNRAAIEKSVAKEQQIALKAYGLLPVVDGEPEVLARYEKLRDVERASAKYGPDRKVHTRAALDAALTNLAKTAGYADASRLQWSLEARAAESGSGSTEWEAGEWRVRIGVTGVQPRLVVSKGSRTLATIPPGLKKTPQFAAAREALDRVERQVDRFRRSLERMMVDGDRLTREDLASIARVPAVRALLQSVILGTEDGALGIYDAEKGTLTTLAGEVTPTEAFVAHPYDLLTEGVLAGWQQALVERRVVQPFKQAFREVYILTPAEREAGAGSLRFSGHRIRPGKAARLLQSRGWLTPHDGDSPVRHSLRHGIAASLCIEGSGHFLGETDSAMTGETGFTRRTEQPTGWRDREVVRLGDVPPAFFSEVMRDADLVVSVARSDESGQTMSPEALARRSEVVTIVARAMGITARCEGHFAFVEGKRAKYRIHLGSAAVHLDPGGHVCIVPATSTGGDRIYLPFPDDDDRGLSEIVSKVVLLAHDDRIADPSIAAQLRQVAARD